MADPQRMETTCASERQGHIIQLRGRKIIQVPSRSCQCGADNLISVLVKVEVSWHVVLRFRASRGTPSTAVRSGTLLVFPGTLPLESETRRCVQLGISQATPQGESARVQAETCGG